MNRFCRFKEIKNILECIEKRREMKQPTLKSPLKTIPLDLRDGRVIVEVKRKSAGSTE